MVEPAGTGRKLTRLRMETCLLLTVCPNGRPCRCAPAPPILQIVKKIEAIIKPFKVEEAIRIRTEERGADAI